MFKTNSVDYSAVSIRDLIWLETALSLSLEIESKFKEVELGISVDIRALLKDLDDVQRISKSGKSNSALKWSDLPSQQKNKNEMKSNDVELRKEFLKQFQKINRNKQEI